MAPKRQRGDSSSTTRAYDRRRFVSVEAAEKFDTYLAGKALTPERGLRPDELLDGEMAHQIIERGWDTFTAHPDPAVIAIVKEFYANAEDKAPYVVMVRGKQVSFSGHTINAFYNLRPPESCQYAHFVRSNPDLEKIVLDLCQPGSAWTSKGRRGAMYFHSKDLSRYGKIWYAFLCAKLMPSQHVSDVPKDKALLLYAIVTGLQINVGLVIEESIRRNLRGHTQGGLPHPSLICGLCRRAGVKWGADEVVQQPLLMLDHGLIERYKVWDGGESDPRGLGFIIPTQSGDEDDYDADDVPDAPTTSGLQPKARFSTQFRNLQLQIDDRTKRLERQNKRLAERQDHMFAYQTNYNTALSEMFARLNPSVDPVQFPEPQPLPVYPPPDSDDDEVEHDA